MERGSNTDGGVKIRISGLSGGRHEYSFSAAPSAVGLDPNFQKNIEVTVLLDKTNNQIRLNAGVLARGQFQCDRCLDMFEQTVSSSYNMVYVCSEDDAGKNRTEEIQIISPDTVEIDLAEDIRQTVLLSIPLKLLCGESCMGLCTRCGMNWNHKACDCEKELRDPRMQGLKDLLKTR